MLQFLNSVAIAKMELHISFDFFQSCHHFPLGQLVEGAICKTYETQGYFL